MRLKSLKYVLVFPICIAACALHLDQSLARPSQLIQPFVASCANDDEISAADRSAIDQAAIQFVQTALSSPAAAYSTFTASAKQTVSIDNFTAMIQRQVQPMGPFTDLHVTHTYVPKVTGGSHDQTVLCGDFSTPETWVAMTAKPGEEQAHVIVEGQTRNYTWDFVIWLGKETGSWHVHYFQFTMVAMVGKDVEDLWMTARAEEHLHHDFNAWVLYTRVLRMTWRGPHFQLGILPEIKKEMTNLEVPPEMQGQPPLNWQFGKSAFKVLTVGPKCMGGNFYLDIGQEVATWADDKDADHKNRELIAGFKVAYPEYTEVFDGLVVTARERGGPRSFQTVDVKPEPVK